MELWLSAMAFNLSPTTRVLVGNDENMKKKLSKKEEKKIHKEIDDIRDSLVEGHVKRYGTTKMFVKGIMIDIKDIVA